MLLQENRIEPVTAATAGFFKVALQKKAGARESVFHLRYGGSEKKTKKRAHDQAYFLAESANKGLFTGAVRWAKALAKRGPTLPLMRELEDAVKHVEKLVSPKLETENRQFVWVGSGTHMDDIDTIFALVAIEIIELGYGRRIRRCKECGKFFVGDPRAKWCSNTCGSKHRVREKRRLDRQRGL